MKYKYVYRKIYNLGRKYYRDLVIHNSENN